jgi:polyisoprenoid-binding protein YceI
VTSSLVAAAGTERFAVLPSDSWVTFEGHTTLHGLKGKAVGLNGYVEAAWNDDGTLTTAAAPRMHFEIPVKDLRSGNAMFDRETWKLIDSDRFPRIAADLRELRPAAAPNQYDASGDVTLAGRSRRYDGELTFTHDGDLVTIDGQLRIDIRDFGLKPPSLLIIKVDPVVKATLHLVARQTA